MDVRSPIGVSKRVTEVRQLCVSAPVRFGDNKYETRHADDLRICAAQMGTESIIIMDSMCYP